VILSGTLHLDPAAHAAATTSLADRLAELDTRRRAIEATVAGLLAGWRGQAATAFRSEWETWCQAAASVSDDLGATVAALDRARGDLLVADDDSGLGPARLEGRLG
jgi:WXG100 family type VII secretion target